jgi:CheY-like chemotaxis protein
MIENQPITSFNSPGTFAPAIGPSDIRIVNPEGERELILLVDDEAFTSLLAERILAAAGYRVVTALDGHQALELYKRLGQQIDLVLLDYAMPVMDGFAVFDRLRKMNPEVAVALTSGVAMPEKIKWMIDNGVRGFIPKPHTAKKLIAGIREILAPAMAHG